VAAALHFRNLLPRKGAAALERPVFLGKHMQQRLQLKQKRLPAMLVPAE